MKKPLILVTNDDGIDAPGIKALIEVVSEIGEVVVVAPDSPQSGQGHAITLSQPLRLYPVKAFEGIEAYKCSGTPVDCVKLAKSVILKGRPADLCVSGINHGSNVAINILYSGTMSAAMEASLEGMNSVGFSLLDFDHNADFEASKPFIKKIVHYLLNRTEEHGVLLNVNIPKLPLEEIKGIKVCRQANARWVEEFAEATDPFGRKYYWMTGEFVNNDPGKDTDVIALEEGYISVVPAIYDLTDRPAIAKLSTMENL